MRKRNLTKSHILGLIFFLVAGMGMATTPDAEDLGDTPCNSSYRVLPFAGSSDGAPGYVDGPLSEARFNTPTSIVPWGYEDPETGNQIQILFVADTYNHVIRIIVQVFSMFGSEVIDEWVGTLAGQPQKAGFKDGKGSAAEFNMPMGLAVDYDSGILYVADAGNNAIRRVDLFHQGQTDTLIAANTVVPPLNRPTGLAWAFIDGTPTLFIADQGSHCIRGADLSNPSSPVVIVAGACGMPGAQDGDARTATLFSGLNRVDWWVEDGTDRGMLFITDRSGVRLLRNGRVTTIFSDPLLGTDRANTSGGSVFSDSKNNLYVASPDRNATILLPYNPAVRDFIDPPAQLNNSGCGEALASPQAVTPFFGLGAVADSGHHSIRVVTNGSGPDLIRRCSSETGMMDNRRRCGVGMRDSRSGVAN